MSETTTAPPAGPEEKPEPAETEAPEQPTPEQSNWERRVSRLTSRVTQVQRERDELAQRLTQIEQRAQGGQQPPPPEVQQFIQAEAQKLAHAQRMQERAQDFHARGAAAYEDWETRCQNLMAMGADAALAQLLVEMPDGARLAGELHDNPDELERIAGIQSERGRAIALGKFAERLEGRPQRTVSRAPRPPSPVAARANPQFNAYTADAQTLAVRWLKEDLEKRQKGGR